MSMPPIEHVVVLMLENRSFDHLLGWLRPEYPSGEFEGLTGSESVPLDPVGGALTPVPVLRLSSPEAYVTSVDPGHEFDDCVLQLYGLETPPEGGAPANTGFVCSYGRQRDADGESIGPEVGKSIVGCVDPSLLPVVSTLARSFVVCDHWFSSVPGPTWPNRFFVHAATSGGYIGSPTSADVIRSQIWSSPHRMRTIYENLEEAGKTWKIYFHDVAQAFALRTLHPHVDRFAWFYPKPDSASSFLEDADSGALPNYSFIEPQYFNAPGSPANDQHPPHDLRYGERLIATVYDALRDNPGIWQRCLFVLLYDEHGGYYDHVPPPRTVTPDGLRAPNGFDFTQLGFRVPVVLVSPWLPAGVVDHAVYDHTSLLGTVKKIFNLPRFLTGRDEEAHTFEGKFLAEPRPREQTPGPLMQLRAVAPAHVVRAASELRLSSHQTSLEALASAVAAPRNEHEASRRIETRVERFLSRTEAP